MSAHEQDLLWVHNPTNKPFTVKWGGHPYTVEPGEKKIFTRFIAEHFAKHLADAILMTREKRYKEQSNKDISLVNNPVERPKIINKILLGTYQEFHKRTEDPAVAIAKQVDQANQQVNLDNAPEPPDTEFEDMGEIDNKALGKLVAPEPELIIPDEEPEKIPEDHTLEEAVSTPEVDLANAPTPDNTSGTPQIPDTDIDAQTTPAEPPKPGENRTRNELLKEAKSLGIQLTGHETKDQLIVAIQNF